MKNNTNIRIPKKYENVITEVWSEISMGDGYWASLKECCICDDTECHWVHEDTVKEFLHSLKSIRIISIEEQIDRFGDDLLDEYREDLATLTEQDRKNFTYQTMTLKEFIVSKKEVQ